MSRPAGPTVLVQVEEALGPGLDYREDLDRGGVAISGSRRGALWLGVDRAFLVDSDDGRGRALPVLVALPSSSFVGARIDAELAGGYAESSGSVLVARLPGAELPVDPILRAAGGVGPEARWLDAHQARDRAGAARRAFRERRSRGRITGGLAWRPPEGIPDGALQGFYSHAERSLDRLPPRFLRGLEGMLDPDERLHYSIQRPWLKDPSLEERVRRHDRRSGLLLLTDREVLWLVDHANPDSYLSDWGVDVELLPVEQLMGVRVQDDADALQLAFDTPGGRHTVAIPLELESDVRIFEALAARFVPDRNGRRLRRTYELKPVEFEEETADRFHQLPEARAFQAEARRDAGELLAFLYSPRREGQRECLGLWLSRSEVGLLGPRGQRLGVGDLTSASIALSPLTARIRLRAGNRILSFPYPGPLAVHGAAFLRLLRRAWANAAVGS
jgi:hypothetical protein